MNHSIRYTIMVYHLLAQIAYTHLKKQSTFLKYLFWLPQLNGLFDCKSVFIFVAVRNIKKTNLPTSSELSLYCLRK